MNPVPRFRRHAAPLAAAALLALSAHALAADPEVPGEILVKLRSTSSLAPLLTKYKLSLVAAFGPRPMYRLRVTGNANVHDKIDGILAYAGSVHAESCTAPDAPLLGIKIVNCRVAYSNSSSLELRVVKNRQRFFGPITNLMNSSCSLQEISCNEKNKIVRSKVFKEKRRTYLAPLPELEQLASLYLSYRTQKISPREFNTAIVNSTLQQSGIGTLMTASDLRRMVAEFAFLQKSSRGQIVAPFLTVRSPAIAQNKPLPLITQTGRLTPAAYILGEDGIPEKRLRTLKTPRSLRVLSSSKFTRITMRN